MDDDAIRCSFYPPDEDRRLPMPRVFRAYHIGDF